MRPNLVKQALRAGRLQVGTSLGHIRSLEIVKILAAGGFHWTFIDAEHGPFNPETLYDLCHAANQCGLCPVVRVASLEYDLVARALDAGAQGVMFPRVEDPDLLAEAISWTKFPPLGIRGYGLTPAHLDYERASIPDVTAHVNEHTLVVMQIETQRAFDRRDELLSVPGLDAVMVGPADLSISLGVPGDFLHSKLVATMEAIRDSCLAHGVAPGTQTRTLDLAQFWRDRGMKFLGCSGDTAMLLDRATEITKTLTA
jgi:2-dehydro-3-deoxyglucarate aldolase/4-hydroxy-2-oxoheptanedioate aldolase